MIVDLRQELPELMEYVKRRVDEHVAKSQTKKLKPVKMIELGFELGQDNWVALVFDTRPDAEPDGEWSRGINRILLRRPKWPILHKLPDDAKMFFIDLSGKKIDVSDDGDEDACDVVGETLKHLLLTAREQRVFDKLLKADRCELGVEHLDGCYGWPDYEDRGKENLV